VIVHISPNTNNNYISH